MHAQVEKLPAASSSRQRPATAEGGTGKPPNQFFRVKHSLSETLVFCRAGVAHKRAPTHMLFTGAGGEGGVALLRSATASNCHRQSAASAAAAAAAAAAAVASSKQRAARSSQQPATLAGYLQGNWLLLGWGDSCRQHAEFSFWSRAPLRLSYCAARPCCLKSKTCTTLAGVPPLTRTITHATAH